MALIDIHHIAIKVKPGQLKDAEDFYTKVLGMTYAKRPDLGFPGAWLDVQNTMIHLVEHEFSPDADPWYRRPEARSAIDHIAIKAKNFDEIKRRVVALGLDWRQTVLSDAGLWQLFVLDPSGVIVELNFIIADEPAGSAGPDESRRYPPDMYLSKTDPTKPKEPARTR
jgi:catechol 2,3-dioxygenase-like lactoylglutathione lyase family enzyme